MLPNARAVPCTQCDSEALIVVRKAGEKGEVASPCKSELSSVAKHGKSLIWMWGFNIYRLQIRLGGEP